MSVPAHLSAALNHLTKAFRDLDEAIHAGMDGPAGGAALEVRADLVRVRRRVRNLALHSGADPASLEHHQHPETRP